MTPFKQDHETLAVMMPNPKWIVLKARSLTSARTKLRTRNSIPIVLCERDLAPDSWREMLEYLRRMDAPPLLIVTSHLADEQLWAEALNLGAHDVLAKPFDSGEITRILSLACSLWRRQQVRIEDSN